MSPKVFISYSHVEMDVAYIVCKVLETSNVKCWIAPRDLLAGIEYGEAIIHALSECNVVVLIFSINANASAQVRREIERAISRGKSVITFRVDKTTPTGALEYALGNTHWLDATTPPLEKHAQALSTVVRRLFSDLAQHSTLESVLDVDRCNNFQTSNDCSPFPKAVSLMPLQSSVQPLVKPLKPLFTIGQHNPNQLRFKCYLFSLLQVCLLFASTIGTVSGIRRKQLDVEDLTYTVIMGFMMFMIPSAINFIFTATNHLHRTAITLNIIGATFCIAYALTQLYLHNTHLLLTGILISLSYIYGAYLQHSLFNIRKINTPT